METTTSQKIIKVTNKKAKPTKAQILANKLVKQHQDNEKLKEKIIKIDLFKLFPKK
jgi:hypothetical protein